MHNDVPIDSLLKGPFVLILSTYTVFAGLAGLLSTLSLRRTLEPGLIIPTLQTRELFDDLPEARTPTTSEPTPEPGAEFSPLCSAAPSNKLLALLNPTYI